MNSASPSDWPNNGQTGLEAYWLAPGKQTQLQSMCMSAFVASKSFSHEALVNEQAALGKRSVSLRVLYRIVSRASCDSIAPHYSSKLVGVTEWRGGALRRAAFLLSPGDGAGCNALRERGRRLPMSEGAARPPPPWSLSMRHDNHWRRLDDTRLARVIGSVT